jgi:hypothetical protein
MYRLVLLVAAPVCISCLKVSNLTPSKFPTTYIEYEGQYHTERRVTADLLFNPSESDRFLAALSGGSGSDPSVSITIDGQTHSMTPLSSAHVSRVYQYSDTAGHGCKASYQYSFTAGNASAGPFTTQVAGYGTFGWYASPQTDFVPYTTAYAEVRFGVDSQLTVTVSNLESGRTVRLEAIRILDHPEHFSVVSPPSFPLQLNCGDTANLVVQWQTTTPPAPQQFETAVLQIDYHFVNSPGGGPSLAVHLKGEGPPG